MTDKERWLSPYDDVGSFEKKTSFCRDCGSAMIWDFSGVEYNRVSGRKMNIYHRRCPQDKKAALGVSHDWFQERIMREYE